GAIVTFNGLDLIVQKFKQVIKVGDVKPVRSGEHLGHTIINPQLTRAYVAIPVARDTAFVLVKSTVIVTDLEVVLCECHKCVVLGYGIAKSTGKASSVVGLYCPHRFTTVVSTRLVIPEDFVMLGQR